jgi:hypothetical protein
MNQTPDIEECRRVHLPKRVRLLLVGESPPANGKFFYFGGAMATITASAFEDAYDVRFGSTEEFFVFFRERGCYLDDLSAVPVNTMSARDRRAALKAAVPDLSRRIAASRPDAVVAILRRIGPLVREAVKGTGCDLDVRVLPFPGMGYQTVFRRGLSEIIRCTLLAQT